MKVVELFTSINGEGTRAGELAVFVRFQGCNLRCSYCDTMWANERDCAYTELTPAEITDRILATGIRNVTLTGGTVAAAKADETLTGIGGASAITCRDRDQWRCEPGSLWHRGTVAACIYDGL